MLLVEIGSSQLVQRSTQYKVTFTGIVITSVYGRGLNLKDVSRIIYQPLCNWP